MPAAPLVSVVMPAYNHERYVQAALRGVIEQEYANIELLVCDDGSRDATYEKILALADECRRRFVRFVATTKKNEGIAPTLNRMITQAEGRFVLPLASDDIVLPRAVARLAGLLESAGAGTLAVCGDGTFIDRDGSPVRLGRWGGLLRPPATGGFERFLAYYTFGKSDFDPGRDFGSYGSLLAGNYLPPCIMVRRDALAAAGGYDAHALAEDYDLLLKLTRDSDVLLVDEPLIRYRIHGDNASLSRANRRRMVRSTFEVLLRERDRALSRGLGPLWFDQIFRYFVYHVLLGDLGRARRALREIPAGTLPGVVAGRVRRYRRALAGSA